MIHYRDAGLGEEARTSLETEGSTCKAGNRRSKRKSDRGSLGLNYFPTFLTPNKGFTVTVALSCKIQDNYTQ